MSDDLWDEIGDAAHASRLSRAEWIRQVCEKALTPPSMVNGALSSKAKEHLASADRPTLHVDEVESGVEPATHMHVFSSWIAGVQKYRCECGEWKS